MLMSWSLSGLVLVSWVLCHGNGEWRNLSCPGVKTGGLRKWFDHWQWRPVAGWPGPPEEYEQLLISRGCLLRHGNNHRWPSSVSLQVSCWRMLVIILKLTLQLFSHEILIVCAHSIVTFSWFLREYWLWEYQHTAELEISWPLSAMVCTVFPQTYGNFGKILP